MSRKVLVRTMPLGRFLGVVAVGVFHDISVATEVTASLTQIKEQKTVFHETH